MSKKMPPRTRQAMKQELLGVDLRSPRYSLTLNVGVSLTSLPRQAAAEHKLGGIFGLALADG